MAQIKGASMALMEYKNQIIIADKAKSNKDLSFGFIIC